MSEREALLRAICDNPDDDTPRLVFADWLQEHGEEDRAEFIRLQVRFAALLRHAIPDNEELARRARELWFRHGQRWLMELPQIPGITWHDAFFRGFPERAVVTTDAVLIANAAVFDLAPVRHIEICEFAAVDGFSQLPCVQRLKTLSLGCSNRDGTVFRRLIEHVRLGESTLLMVGSGLSGNERYAELRAAFGDQLLWTCPPPAPQPPTQPPPTSPPATPSRRRRRR